MADRTKIFEGFSITHAQVLDGATAFAAAASTEALDIYGVDQASMNPQFDEYDNEGDDDILSTWSYLKFVDLDIRGGYFSFPLITTLTGAAVTSSGANAGIKYEQELWHEDSTNVAPKPVLLRALAKDSDGTPCRVDLGFYRALFKPITFVGPKYKDGLKIGYMARALKSRKDEAGVAFVDGKKHVARVINAVAL